MRFDEYRKYYKRVSDKYFMLMFILFWEETDEPKQIHVNQLRNNNSESNATIWTACHGASWQWEGNAYSLNHQ